MQKYRWIHRDECGYHAAFLELCLPIFRDNKPVRIVDDLQECEVATLDLLDTTLKVTVKSNDELAYLASCLLGLYYHNKITREQFGDVYLMMMLSVDYQQEIYKYSIFIDNSNELTDAAKLFFGNHVDKALEKFKNISGEQRKNYYFIRTAVDTFPEELKANTKKRNRYGFIFQFAPFIMTSTKPGFIDENANNPSPHTNRTMAQVRIPSSNLFGLLCHIYPRPTIGKSTKADVIDSMKANEHVAFLTCFDGSTENFEILHSYKFNPSSALLHDWIHCYLMATVPKKYRDAIMQFHELCLTFYDEPDIDEVDSSSWMLCDRIESYSFLLKKEIQFVDLVCSIVPELILFDFSLQHPEVKLDDFMKRSIFPKTLQPILAELAFAYIKGHMKNSFLEASLKNCYVLNNLPKHIRTKNFRIFCYDVFLNFLNSLYQTLMVISLNKKFEINAIVNKFSASQILSGLCHIYFYLQTHPKSFISDIKNECRDFISLTKALFAFEDGYSTELYKNLILDLCNLILSTLPQDYLPIKVARHNQYAGLLFTSIPACKSNPSITTEKQNPQKHLLRI